MIKLIEKKNRIISFTVFLKTIKLNEYYLRAKFNLNCLSVNIFSPVPKLIFATVQKNEKKTQCDFF